MKNLMNKFLILLSFVAVFSACEEEDLVVINEDFTTTVALSNNDIVLEEENEDLTALTVAWEEPDFGYNAAAEYNIRFTLGANVEIVNTGRPMVENGVMGNALVFIGLARGRKVLRNYRDSECSESVRTVLRSSLFRKN